MTGRDDNAILEECERGEDVAVKTYEEALGVGLPGNVEEVVRRQFAQVKEAHDRVRNLRNQSRGA